MVLKDPFFNNFVLFMIGAAFVAAILPVEDNVFFTGMLISNYGVLLAILHAYNDSLIRVTVKINHTFRAIYRTIFLSWIPLVLFGFTKLAIIALLTELTVFYMIFDYAYIYFKNKNQKLNYAWYYVGTTAKIDIFIRKINKIPIMNNLFPYWLLVLKITIFIICSINFLKLLYATY